MVEYQVGNINVNDKPNYENLRAIMKQSYQAVSAKVDVKTFAKKVGVSANYMGQVLSKKAMKITKGQANKMVEYLNKTANKKAAEVLAQPYAVNDNIADKLAEEAHSAGSFLEKMTNELVEVEGRVTDLESDVGDAATTKYVDEKVAELEDQSMEASPEAYTLLEKAAETRARCLKKLKKLEDARKAREKAASEAAKGDKK